MDEHATNAATPGSSTPARSGRRRFLGAGVGAAPAVLTLTSSPALASGLSCTSPSRSMSMHASTKGRPDQGFCNGESPGNYKAQADAYLKNGQPNPAYHWPSLPGQGSAAAPSPDTQFHAVFTPSGQFDGETMLQVLSRNGTGDPFKLAFHLIGAYLNCVRGLIPVGVLTTDQVQAIYSAYRSPAGYTPVVGGLPWTASQIVDYLKNNGIAP